jgi:hypothetical protein
MADLAVFAFLSANQLTSISISGSYSAHMGQQHRVKVKRMRRVRRKKRLKERAKAEKSAAGAK